MGDTQKKQNSKDNDDSKVDVEEKETSPNKERDHSEGGCCGGCGG